MKHLLIILILLIAISLTAIETDKILHFLVSAGIYDVTYNLTYRGTNLQHDTCEGIGFWTAFSVGLGKEIYDEYSENGTGFNNADMFYNVIGIVSSLGFNRYLQKLEYQKMILMLNKNKVSVGIRF